MVGQPSRILIIGPSWVGDMVMAQSLFKLLKQQNPTCIIDVLAPAWTFSLVRCMPEVSDVIEMPISHGELKLLKRYQLAKTLQKRHYDQAIVLPNSFKAALIPMLAGIPKRTGWVGEFRYGLLNDARRLDKKRYPLMIEQYLALGLAPNAALPAVYPYPEFSISSQKQRAVLAKYLPNWQHQKTLVLCPGAEFGPSKRWPSDYYAQVANQKLAQNWDVWLLGSKKDKLVIDQIQLLTEHRCKDLTETSLAEAIDVLSLATGVITNDSGLMHVAAALNKPLVAIYGSTSPAFTPPLSVNATILKLNLPCQPCFERDCPLKHHHCMQQMTPDRVLLAITDWGNA